MSIKENGGNPFRFFLKPVFLTQAIANGIGSAAGGFAYAFAVPSVIISTLRGGAVLFATMSGGLYFKESGRFLKVFVAVGIICGLILLA